MNTVGYWFMTGLALVILTGWIGNHVTQKGVLGILIDDRGRYSLTHLQVALWSLVLLSLLAAIVWARAVNGLPATDWVDIEIPQEILVLAGISSSSAVVATAVKSPRSEKARTDAKAGNDEVSLPTPHFSQVYTVEEGTFVDQVIDIAKFQNFFLTLIAVGVYVAISATMLAAPPTPTGFPPFNDRLLWLIGISHVAYVGGKFPERMGTPARGTLKR